MANELMIMRLTSFREHAFPFLDGDPSVPEPDFGRFEPLEGLREHLLRIPGASAEGEHRIRWRSPSGAELRLGVDAGSILIGSEGSWGTALELLAYLRERYEDVVIVTTEDGTVFDEEAFRNVHAQAGVP